MTLTVSPKTKDILSYESEVWTSADVLRSSVGLKNSEFPDFMMPFFALRLVESRLIRKYEEISQDKALVDEQDRIDEIRETVGFYNSVVIEQKKTLKDITSNDTTFYADFSNYLNSFDDELKSLLGIVNSDKTENLNLGAVIESLRRKQALFGYSAAWGKIDFTPYDNSEVTTLEEHIKRKWADMSAETAGEHYTASDIINFIAELCATDDFQPGYPYKIYDMTCGGGNMLFGVEDRIKEKNSMVRTETYGQELRGSLFSLSKIESSFRKDSYIEHGNTLTHDMFVGKQFDYGVANPPYGVSWKEEQKLVQNDQTGRFGHGGYPSVSDGQLLFVQHMISKLNNKGKAFIVLNGSPLFSGDAGSGESNIRKWILENDYLEALIQLPTNIFFNTGITTYIWCLNKNKAENRKNKILCINAEDSFVKMKKNKGNKSKEISPQQAKDLAKLYKDFSNSPISKVLSKYEFYYNKQSLKKLEKDEAHGAFNEGLESLKITDIAKIVIQTRENNDSTTISALITNKIKEEADSLNTQFKEIDNETQKLTVVLNNQTSYSLDENHCIIEDKAGIQTNLGYGDIKLKAVYKKSTNKTAENIVLECVLEPVWTKDDEKIDYSPNTDTNHSSIQEFMAKWVSKDPKDYQLLDNTIGVEINFNSIFPKKIEIRSTEDILKEIDTLDKKLENHNE